MPLSHRQPPWVVKIAQLVGRPVGRKARSPPLPNRGVTLHFPSPPLFNRAPPKTPTAQRPSCTVACCCRELSVACAPVMHCGLCMVAHGVPWGLTWPPSQWCDMCLLEWKACCIRVWVDCMRHGAPSSAHGRRCGKPVAVSEREVCDWFVNAGVHSVCGVNLGLRARYREIAWGRGSCTAVGARAAARS